MAFKNCAASFPINQMYQIFTKYFGMKVNNSDDWCQCYKKSCSHFAVISTVFLYNRKVIALGDHGRKKYANKKCQKCFTIICKFDTCKFNFMKFVKLF